MSEPLLDPQVYDELAEAVGADFAAELAMTFLQDAPNMIAALKAAVKDGDADGYRRAAHSLKSNADTFGASALATQARGMELTELQAADPPIPALEAIYDQTAAALRALTDG